MALITSTYGKERVRILRLARDGDRHTPRELTVTALMRGAFDAAWTGADNRACVATDSVKNIVNVTAARNLDLCKEEFVEAVAKVFLEEYPQIEEMTVEAHETRWRRKDIAGAPHDHTFVLDGNGKAYVRLVATREAATLQSGVRGFTFMKTTRSGWANFVDDAYRTLADTQDRIAATSMDATWTWSAPLHDYEALNSAIVGSMIEEFGTTYSYSIQDSMFRMGKRALRDFTDLAEISFAMPNKHYIPIDLGSFGLDNLGTVFMPTDEPYGQITATLGR